MRRTFCTSVFGFLTLILLLLAGRTTLAQSTTDGAIGGTVYDTSGAPVAGAKISVRNNGTNSAQEETTDESGYYRVTKLQPATYTVSIAAQGFADFRAEHVVVQIGTVTELSPRLQVSSTGPRSW
jgi:protocatechuate 3,4-dioxygenase beta subunit